MLGHVSEILAGGSRGYKPWCLDRRQREGMRYPGAIFLDFVWSKLVCPPPERGKTALGCRSSGHGDFTGVTLSGDDMIGSIQEQHRVSYPLL